MSEQAGDMYELAGQYNRALKLYLQALLYTHPPTHHHHQQHAFRRRPPSPPPRFSPALRGSIPGGLSQGTTWPLYSLRVALDSSELSELSDYHCDDAGLGFIRVIRVIRVI